MICRERFHEIPSTNICFPLSIEWKLLTAPPTSSQTDTASNTVTDCEIQLCCYYYLFRFAFYVLVSLLHSHFCKDEVNTKAWSKNDHKGVQINNRELPCRDGCKDVQSNGKCFRNRRLELQFSACWYILQVLTDVVAGWACMILHWQ